MTTLLAVLSVLSLLLLFAASAAARVPAHLPRLLGRARDARSLLAVHRGMILHVALGLASAGTILAGLAGGAIAFGLAAVGLVVSRVAGHWTGVRWPRVAHRLSAPLAPYEGIALLIDWAVSAVERGRGRAATQPVAANSPDHAYQNVLELTQKTVEKVMIPRSEVIWLAAKAGKNEILETIARRRHSRYPVFEGDFEQPLGLIDLVDLLSCTEETITAARLARPAVIVPETMGCDDLVEKMRAEQFDTAIVADEFGAMAGLVTLEDLLEILVGELVGEHESVPIRIRRLEDGSWLAAGTVRLEEFEDIFGISLPEGDYETIAGLFLQRVSRIPHVGEELDLGDLLFEIASTDARRIRAIRVVFRVPTRADERRAI
jgi:magnesium and cobalt transporter